MERDFFDESYRGVPPWDIGRPQRAFVQLEAAGEIQGSVLDVGCGTGENALYVAGKGHPTWGIDASPRAIRKARAKARNRNRPVTFRVADALHLESLGETFDTAIDSGLFHTFSDPDRDRFARSLAQVLRPAGRYFLLCFSEHEPEGWGPRRVTKAEIRSTFGPGWEVLSIEEARFEAHSHEDARAWLATVRRR